MYRPISSYSQQHFLHFKATYCVFFLIHFASSPTVFPTFSRATTRQVSFQNHSLHFAQSAVEFVRHHALHSLAERALMSPGVKRLVVRFMNVDDIQHTYCIYIYTHYHDIYIYLFIHTCIYAIYLDIHNTYCKGL